jgi:mRNA-degrading endonuclease toxin of MazEF toxin-antitoxin module
MTAKINAGNVYWVKDSEVKLPPEDLRTGKHPRRMVMVLSNNKINQDPIWKIVMVAPISTSEDFRTQYCVQLDVPEGNVTETCWVRTVAIQPLAKSDLGDFTGKVSGDRLEDVMQELVALLPLTVEEDEVLEWSDAQADSGISPLKPVAPLPSAVFARRG